MLKKRKLKKELTALYRAFVFLILLGFFSWFMFLYSYGQIKSMGTDKGAELASQKGVDVFLRVAGNNPPIILDLLENIYACEGNFLDYPVRVMDIDGDIPVGTLNPLDPFYIIYFSKIDSITNSYKLISATLSKADAGGVNGIFKNYLETVFMSDGLAVDSKQFNITVIEINNLPFIENIGVKTVWTHGDNNIFDYKVDVSDIEDGNSDSGNLIFNISFSGDKLFNISQNGTMYFKPNPSQIGVYNVSVCVRDLGLENPHPNISLCNQDGRSLQPCNNFSLTVTDRNRAPEIINYFPRNLSLEISGEENIFFNITSYDPDQTIPDIYWYVDDEIKKYDSMKSRSNFSFSYICGFGGRSVIKAIVTDGELNSSVQWNISVNGVICPSLDSGGGGGGGGGVACSEKWVCGEWSKCNNLKDDYSLGKTNYKLDTLLKERCSVLNWNDETCGYQVRECKDLKKCRTNLTKPGIYQECYYTENPTCSDGIKNCYNGSCEIIADCGGPCPACPTCSDGIKNQNEEEIDCGGVCSACKKEIPRLNVFKYVMYISLIFLILALIGVIILGIKYILLRKKLVSEKPKDENSFENIFGKGYYRTGTSVRRGF